MKITGILFLGFLILSVSPLFGAGRAEEKLTDTEAVMAEQNSAGKVESAVLGGGCFWCVEAVYERIPGVKNVVSGYAGGETADPSYEEVCSGSTGHAEVVRIDYDPDVISYEEILDLFWRAHDPTTLNRQGADAGTQYRSIILYTDERQRETAEASKERAQKEIGKKVVTYIQPLETFYEAEGYHQDYYEKNPYAGYCSFVIRPKLKKLELE